ncbi:MAG: S8 family serine peptidase [Cyanobacteria bacterium J06592_8]
MDFFQDNTFLDSGNVNILAGTPDADQIFGLEGNDFIFGAESGDQLFGNLGFDTVVGHQGDDQIYGGAEADLLFGGRGDDSIFGDEGSDTIHGDRGTDILIGGEGEDVFVLSLGTGNFIVTQTDLIVDFQDGEDQIQLLDGLTFADLNFEETPAGDTLIRDIESGEMLALLQGVNQGALTADNFIDNSSPPQPGTSTITLSLANDTGLDDQDNITSDPTLTGTVSNPSEIAELEIAIDGEFVSINTEIAEDGSFTFSENQLESALNISFAENEAYTVQLRSIDTDGVRSNIAELTFTLAPDGSPPEQELEFFPPGTDFLQPSVTAFLANDTGSSDSDSITSDATITGTAIDNVGIAQLEVSIGAEFVPVTTNIAADGSFILTQNQLETALNTDLIDGANTVFLRAVDTSGLRSLNLAPVSFTLDGTPPTITAQLANDTGDNNSDGITTDPTITGSVSDASEIVALRAGSEGNLIDISSQLEADGRFEFEQLQLEAFLGESLVENTSYTLQLQAEDEFGLVAQTTVSFTLEEIPDETVPIDAPPPPEDVEIIDDDDDQTPPQIEPPEEREVIEEPGNSIEDAFDIAVSSNPLTYSNQVSGDDLDDFYVFTLGAAGSISIDLEELSSDADLVLLDSNGSIIDFSDAIGITDESITRPLEAGTYYIQVTSFDQETTDYDLSVSVTSRLPGITTTGSQESFELFTNFSSQLINLEPSSTDPNMEAFRTDPRFAGIDGSGFSVVVIDSGLDLDHPFFGPDSDGNGIADRIVYQQDFADNDFDASDVIGHGSNVTSIVASEDDEFPGMAPGVNIIHLKVTSDNPSSDQSTQDFFNTIEEALKWVVVNAEEYNIASVNMSLGDPRVIYTPEFSPVDLGIDYGLDDELAALVNKNVIVTSASGNSFFEFDSLLGVSYPSSNPNSLSVGAVWDGDNGGPFGNDLTTGADRITAFSQRHPELTDIFAPGAFITGADQNGETVGQAGTSQASPHIAGIAALAQQLAVQELGRRLTFDEFRNLLQDTGVTIFDGDDEDDNVVNTGLEFKRVDVLALGEAILDLGDDIVTPPPPSEPDLVRYDFAYLYDGATLEDDFYLGYTYAEPGTFDLNTFYDDFPGENEDGFNGLYLVFDDTGEVSSDAILDEVYVIGYFDKESSDSLDDLYTPFYFENGFASGFDGLGSEYDFIELEDGTFDDFGFDFYEADGIEEIFSNDRFTRTDYDANSQPGRIVNGDLNSDGFDELIVANTNESDRGFSILFNQGDGSFEQPLDFLSSAGSSLDVGDINGDSNTDLVVVNSNTNEVSIYFGDGNGNLFTPSTFEAGDRPVISETTDVDSDGNTDVVLINSEFDEFGVGYGGDSLSVLFNRTGDNRETLTAGEGVRDVVAADLDGDGDFDLATANEREDTVSVLINFGNIIFSDPIKYDVGDRPVNIIADDLDGNGTVDLATTDFGSDTVSVLRNSGDGFFAPALTFTTNENPSNLSAADLDGDGNSDLVMLNSVFFEDGDREGNSISLLLNDGDATFNEPLSFTVGEVPFGLIVEDLDGNGRLDIATSNFDSQDVTVYLQS